MKEVNFTLSDISYKAWYGDFKAFSDFTSLTPAATGTSPELTCEVLTNEDLYGIQYTGTINVPEDGNYAFNLAVTGNGRLTINNEEIKVARRRGGNNQTPIALKKGSYPFEILNFKNASPRKPQGHGKSLRSLSGHRALIAPVRR